MKGSRLQAAKSLWLEAYNRFLFWRMFLIPITIEDMRKEDIDEILEIERTSFPSPWTREAFLAELKERDSSCFLVAKSEGRVVGYAGFWITFDEAHITNLAVHPEYRKKKIGERLIRFLLKLAVSKGAERATLEVRPSNSPAQNLYKKFGFEVGGIQKGYYSDTGEDALIMRNNNLTPSLTEERG